MPEVYAIHGRHPGAEYKRAKDCIAEAFNEVITNDPRVIGVGITADRFAEAVLARLAALYPPMLVVSLEPPVARRKPDDAN